MNACTDFFLNLEKQGRIINGGVDMPEDLAPDAVAAVVRFLYTGRLDVRGAGTFDRLLATTKRLKINVLAKLMNTQLNAPPANNGSQKKKMRRRREDPVSQMKKIKTIEKKFANDEKRTKIQAKMEAMMQRKVQEDEATYGSDTVPGKKLPIWRKRSSSQQPEPKSSNLVSTPNKSPMSSPVVQKSYNRHANVVESTSPKGAKQVKEMQSNMTFEKIRKNPSAKSSSEVFDSNDSISKDMSVEEISEMMAEQRRRLAEDDDDYYDNDAGLDYDEVTAEDEEDATLLPTTPAVTQAKPILKSETKVENSTPRKSVRFSLRPGNVQTPSGIDETNRQSNNEKSPTPKKRGRKRQYSGPGAKTKDKEPIDIALEEFEKAADEEERGGLRQSKRLKGDKGQAKVVTNSNSPSQSKTTLPKKSPIVQKVQVADRNQMVRELLKKNPNLLKDNKQVKVKVMVKDANGKAKFQYLTIKASNSQQIKLAPKEVSTSSQDSVSSLDSSANNLGEESESDSNKQAENQTCVTLTTEEEQHLRECECRENESEKDKGVEAFDVDEEEVRSNQSENKVKKAGKGVQLAEEWDDEDV